MVGMRRAFDGMYAAVAVAGCIDCSDGGGGGAVEMIHTCDDVYAAVAVAVAVAPVAPVDGDDATAALFRIGWPSASSASF